MKCAFFEGMDMDYIDLLTDNAELILYRQGDFLLEVGKPANEFFLILDGNVMIDLFDSKDHEIDVSPLERGDLVGWSWLHYPFEWQFNALALTDVRVLAFNAEAIRKECFSNNDFGFEFQRRIASVISQRLESSRKLIIELAPN